MSAGKSMDERDYVKKLALMAHYGFALSALQTIVTLNLLDIERYNVAKYTKGDIEDEEGD